MNTMKLAHKNAKYGANKFGGKPFEYFAESLKLAHKGIDLQAEANSKLNKSIAFCLGVIGLVSCIIGVILSEPVSLIA